MAARRAANSVPVMGPSTRRLRVEFNRTRRGSLHQASLIGWPIIQLRFCVQLESQRPAVSIPEAPGARLFVVRAQEGFAA